MLMKLDSLISVCSWENIATAWLNQVYGHIDQHFVSERSQVRHKGNSPPLFSELASSATVPEGSIYLA